MVVVMVVVRWARAPTHHGAEAFPRPPVSERLQRRTDLVQCLRKDYTSIRILN